MKAMYIWNSLKYIMWDKRLTECPILDVVAQAVWRNKMWVTARDIWSWGQRANHVTLQVCEFPGHENRKFTDFILNNAYVGGDEPCTTVGCLSSYPWAHRFGSHYVFPSVECAFLASSITEFFFFGGGVLLAAAGGRMRGSHSQLWENPSGSWNAPRHPT